MRKGLSSIRLGIKLSLLGVIALLASVAGATLAQGNQARMSLELPVEQVKEGGPDFRMSVVADNFANLAAFQFTLSYDPSIIKYVAASAAATLGSTGREVMCPDPRVEPGKPETLKFNCVTLGPPVSMGGKAGPNGYGVLADITFAPVGGGTVSLDLKDGVLLAAEIDARGAPAMIDTVTEGSSLEVISSGGGFAWALWGPVAGVVALVVMVGTVVVVVVRLRSSRGLGSIGG